MDIAPARITVSRNAADDVQDRQVVVSLDGERWVSLMFGHSATREIAAGHHVLKADNTLFRKALEFDIEPGSELRFCVASHRGPGTSLFLLLGAPFYYVRVAREEAV
jgi:hypothetical protein